MAYVLHELLGCSTVVYVRSCGLFLWTE